MVEFEVLRDDGFKQILDIMFEQRLVGVLAKDQLEMGMDQLSESLLGKGRALFNNHVSVLEGTDRAKNYREVTEILVDLQEKIAGLYAAVGTKANIVSVHYAVVRGVTIVIAADSMPPLAGMYALPKSQAKDAEAFRRYVTEHIDDFAGKLNLFGKQADALRDNPLTMDPIAYCKARNVINFFACSDRDGMENLFSRGARTGKVFNYIHRSPSEWNSLTAAIASDYAEEFEGLMGTGGLLIEAIKEGKLTSAQIQLMQKGNLVVFGREDKVYVDTITPCLGTGYFRLAGSSDLAKGTIDEVAEKAALYAGRVREKCG